MGRNQESEEQLATFPARVAKVLDEYRLVINRGEEHGIKRGQRVLVYKPSEEIFDPETGKSLGVLELVKGTGKVIHVQPEMSTIESDATKEERTIQHRKTISWALEGFLGPQTVYSDIVVPFEEPMENDLVKPI